MRGDALARVAALFLPLAVAIGGWCPAGHPRGQRQPIPSARVASAATEAFTSLLPAANPTHQPDAFSPPHRPTLFATNIEQEQMVTETLLGRRVTLTMRAVWTWDFGDGGTLTTTTPGGVYPDTSISHIYARAGKYTVKLTTTWTGTYSVDGGPAQPIPGPFARQSTPFIVDVRDAGPTLIA